MYPVLVQFGDVSIRSYAVAVIIGVIVAVWIRRHEVERVGLQSLPGHRWVLLGALLGAVVGAKVGMVLFEPMVSWQETLWRSLSLDFAGKTVVGGLVGGYLGVEISKRWVGIRRSTGDGFAVALPVAQAVGRLGCLPEGCCYGVATELPWAIERHGSARHPVQLYEGFLDLALAAWLWSIRDRPMPSGHLFRRYLVGYGSIRFGVEFFRGDPVRVLGPLNAVQWLCLAAVVGFAVLIVRGERRQTA